jgi:hypothetical protein
MFKKGIENLMIKLFSIHEKYSNISILESFFLKCNFFYKHIIIALKINRFYE